jgi:hypothetical protein
MSGDPMRLTVLVKFMKIWFKILEGQRLDVAVPLCGSPDGPERWAVHRGVCS